MIVTGIIAISPNKIEKSKCNVDSFLIESKKTILTKKRGTKQIPIDAKRFIHISYITLENFVRYFYDYFMWN